MGYFSLHIEKNNYLLKMPLEFIIAPSSVFSAGNIDIHNFPIVSISKALTIYCPVYGDVNATYAEFLNITPFVL